MVEKEFEVYLFDDRGYGKHWFVATSQKEAVDLYENTVNSEAKDERLDSIECNYEFKPDYQVTKLSSEEVEKVRILDPCGGFVDYSATKVIKDYEKEGRVIPYLLCSTG